MKSTTGIEILNLNYSLVITLLFHLFNEPDDHHFLRVNHLSAESFINRYLSVLTSLGSQAVFTRFLCQRSKVITSLLLDTEPIKCELQTTNETMCKREEKKETAAYTCHTYDFTRDRENVIQD